MTWTRVDAVEPGKVAIVSVNGKDVAVCNAGGEYFAIDDVCTHDGGPLDQGQLDGHEIECPRHGARFDIRSGRALSLPAVRPVKTYPTRVEDDAIEVDIS